MGPSTGHTEKGPPAVAATGVTEAKDEGDVPASILRVAASLEASGLEDVGIFRLSPDPTQIEQIKLSIDRGYDVDLSIFSVHSVAAAFKAYFRQLPGPLIPPTVYRYFPELVGKFASSLFALPDKESPQVNVLLWIFGGNSGNHCSLSRWERIIFEKQKQE
jgi:hypothetical protein